MADHPVDRSGKPDLKWQVEFDAARRDLEVAKMSVTQLESEKKALAEKLEKRNSEMEQVYKRLHDSKVPLQK